MTGGRQKFLGGERGGKGLFQMKRPRFDFPFCFQRECQFHSLFLFHGVEKKGCISERTLFSLCFVTLSSSRVLLYN